MGTRTREVALPEALGDIAASDNSESYEKPEGDENLGRNNCDGAYARVDGLRNRRIAGLAGIRGLINPPVTG